MSKGVSKWGVKGGVNRGVKVKTNSESGCQQPLFIPVFDWLDRGTSYKTGNLIILRLDWAFYYFILSRFVHNNIGVVFTTCFYEPGSPTFCDVTKMLAFCHRDNVNPIRFSFSLNGEIGYQKLYILIQVTVQYKNSVTIYCTLYHSLFSQLFFYMIAIKQLSLLNTAAFYIQL